MLQLFRFAGDKMRRSPQKEHVVRENYKKPLAPARKRKNHRESLQEAVNQYVQHVPSPGGDIHARALLERGNSLLCGLVEQSLFPVVDNGAWRLLMWKPFYCDDIGSQDSSGQARCRWRSTLQEYRDIVSEHLALEALPEGAEEIERS